MEAGPHTQYTIYALLIITAGCQCEYKPYSTEPLRYKCNTTHTSLYPMEATKLFRQVVDSTHCAAGGLPCRYRLGLIQPPPPPVAEDITPEWIELRPRWPLTSHKHSNSMPPTLSMKRPGKQAVSLTDLTQEELRSMGQGQETAAAASSPNNNSL
eukprot:GHRR01021753.1.p1 GENE.GHRR01021753.1~~GHRR01021753.1.p1  ORF type:complete len:155 (-),score=32.90 GHRR01021753.1:227-691(-)